MQNLVNFKIGKVFKIIVYCLQGWKGVSTERLGPAAGHCQGFPPLSAGHPVPPLLPGQLPFLFVWLLVIHYLLFCQVSFHSSLPNCWSSSTPSSARSASIHLCLIVGHPVHLLFCQVSFHSSLPNCWSSSISSSARSASIHLCLIVGHPVHFLFCQVSFHSSLPNCWSSSTSSSARSASIPLYLIAGHPVAPLLPGQLPFLFA